MKKFWIIFLIYFLGYANGQAYKIIENVEGKGTDYRTARLEAYRIASEKAYGVSIVSNTEIKNFQAIADKLFATTKGYIHSSEGETVEQKEGMYIVRFSRVIVSESVKGIIDKIQEISEGLKSLNFPSLTIATTNLDSTFLGHIENFLVNNLGVVIESQEKAQYIIESFLEISKGELKVSGKIKNKQNQTISSCANLKMKYINEEDKQFAAHILIITLLESQITWPTITVRDIKEWRIAKLIEKHISDLGIVVHCNLVKYKDKKGDYTVKIKGSLNQLATEMMEKKIFNLETIEIDEIKRVLIVDYTSDNKYELVEKDWFEKFKKEIENLTESNKKELEKFKSGIEKNILYIIKKEREERERYWLPSHIWDNCICTHNNEKILDMSTNYWLSLSVSDQIKYSAMYQEGYGKAKNLEIEITKNGIVFHLIPPGKFWMGTPYTEKDRSTNEKKHQVIISKPFYMARTELTQAQWEAVMGSNPSKNKGSNLPVESVSWDDCKSFCNKTGFLLPTEAQWEYACRAGVTAAFNIGDNINTDIVNYDGNNPYKDAPKGIYRGKTVEVGILPNKNAWGLYDMHGNVYERCEDLYGEYIVGEYIDPKGARTGSTCIERGGSYNSNAWDCRSGNRSTSTSFYRSYDSGLRPVIYP